MSATRTFVISFSDTRRWQTTVAAGNADEAITSAEALWNDGGVDGEHPFDLIADFVFSQPEWRIQDASPPERSWSVAFHRASVHQTLVRAHTEHEAIGIAKAMLHETDVSLFQRNWCEDTCWQAELGDGGVSCQ